MTHCVVVVLVFSLLNLALPFQILIPNRDYRLTRFVLKSSYRGSGNSNDAVGRRRKRSLPPTGENTSSGSALTTTNESVASISNIEQQIKPATATSSAPVQPQVSPSPQRPANVPSEDGTSSLEELFGLNADQLVDLMEDELPVPREDLITGQAIQGEESDKNKVFQLPDLMDFMDDNTGKGGKSNRQKRKEEQEIGRVKIDRRNQEEYLRVMQLNPFADADESLFIDEYDIIPAIFGSGKLLSIPVPYLQTGHGVLLLVSVLAAFVYAPGNPLTAFPTEIRTFLQQGLFVVTSINLVLAVQAGFIANSKGLPVTFWVIKTLLLGGIPFYEITQAKDPTTMNVAGEDSSRAAIRRRNRENKN